MGYADIAGHWFLHAYDQYELWNYFIEGIKEVFSGASPADELPIALDTEQFIFGSTVFKKPNWPVLLENVTPGIPDKDGNKFHSIDVDEPLVFDAPQDLFEIQSCHARFLGRPHAPIYWHGNGPWKPAWEGLRNRLVACGCFASQSSVRIESKPGAKLNTAC